VISYLYHLYDVYRFVPGGAGYDTSSAFQMHSMQLNAGQQPAITNIMLAAEQIRVDCVQLTTNGRYVVTGSIYGPPQVWDLKVYISISIYFIQTCRIKPNKMTVEQDNKV